MAELNQAIAHIPIPDRMTGLPISPKGFPMPWFVPWKDGEPQPTSADPEKVRRARQFNLCWLCGQTTGRYLAFVIGPMCLINRVTSEPPSHRECAEYAVKACPFLTKPKAKRNPNKPDGHVPPAGMMIQRNPGVSVIYISHSYSYERGIFHLGQPVNLTFWREGRRATHDEIMESITTGMPLLRDAAATDGYRALDDLEAQYRRAMELIPS